MRSELAVRTEDQVDPGARSSLDARRRHGCGPRRCPRLRRRRSRQRPHVQQVGEEVGAELTDVAVGPHSPWAEPPAFAPSTRRPPTSAVICGAESGSACTPCRAACARLGTLPGLGHVVAETVSRRLEVSRRTRSSVSWPGIGIGPTGGERHARRSWPPAAEAAASMAAPPPSTIRSASDTWAPPLPLNARTGSLRASRSRCRHRTATLTSQPTMGLQTDSSAIGATTEVGAAGRSRPRPRPSPTSSDGAEAGVHDGGLQLGDHRHHRSRAPSWAGTLSCQTKELRSGPASRRSEWPGPCHGAAA